MNVTRLRALYCCALPQLTNPLVVEIQKPLQNVACGRPLEAEKYHYKNRHDLSPHISRVREEAVLMTGNAGKPAGWGTGHMPLRGEGS